jgi:hypothetical protein
VEREDDEILCGERLRQAGGQALRQYRREPRPCTRGRSCAAPSLVGGFVRRNAVRTTTPGGHRMVVDGQPTAPAPRARFEQVACPARGHVDASTGVIARRLLGVAAQIFVSDKAATRRFRHSIRGAARAGLDSRRIQASTTARTTAGTRPGQGRRWLAARESMCTYRTVFTGVANHHR